MTPSTHLRIDGAEYPTELLSAPTPSGSTIYQCSTAGPGGITMSLAYERRVTGVLTGFLELRNDSDSDRSVAVELTIPWRVPVRGSCQGNITLSGQLPINGGAVHADPRQNAVWRLLCDANPAAAGLYGAIVEGSGSTSFGRPESVPKTETPAAETITLAQQLVLTPGVSAKIATTIRLLSAADLNGDGVVDGPDLATLLSQWGGAGTADLNRDGRVDGADLALLNGAWTQSSGVGA